MCIVHYVKKVRIFMGIIQRVGKSCQNNYQMLVFFIELHSKVLRIPK